MIRTKIGARLVTGLAIGALSAQAWGGCRLDLGATLDDFGNANGCIPFAPGTPINTHYVQSQNIVFGTSTGGAPVKIDVDLLCPPFCRSGAPGAFTAFDGVWSAAFKFALAPGVPDFTTPVGVEWFSAELCFIMSPPGTPLMQGFDNDGNLIAQALTSGAHAETLTLVAPPGQLIALVKVFGNLPDEQFGVSVDCLDYPDPVAKNVAQGCCMGGGCIDLPPAQCTAQGGFATGPGSECATVSCPVNDDCRSSLPIGNGSTWFSNQFATLDGPSPCGALGSDIWYEYQATFTGVITVSTCNSNFDTVVAVYDNCGCPAMGGHVLDCDDDFCGFGAGSQVNVEVCAGQCYRIQVGGFGGDQGSGLISIEKGSLLLCGNPAAGNCFLAHGPCAPYCNNQKCCNLVCGMDAYCCTITWDQLCASEALQFCGDCGDPDAGNCYADNGTPGCNDAICCQAVCTVDAYCCHVEWDSVCADQAGTYCAGPPIPCPGEGACRTPHPNPGCSDQECCELICSIDPFCCDIEWDQVCASEAVQLCPNIGGCPGTGDCFVPNGTPGCADAVCCELVCALDPFCCGVEWDQLCADAAAKLCVEQCPGTGSCFQEQGTPGCEDDECCKTVCFQDAFCCQAQWDATCVALALDLCLPPVCGPGAGNCFVPNGTPGCELEFCCEKVCQADLFCCKVTWDSICASLAMNLCIGSSPCGPGAGPCDAPHPGPGCDDEECCAAVCSLDPFCCATEWDIICAIAAQFICNGQLSCPGDVNGSGLVDVTDLLLVVGDMGCQRPARCVGDANVDGACDVQDMVTVLMHWGGCE
jgi:hypothetical protein